MLALLGVAEAHIPILYTFGPADDWCAFLNQAADVGGAFYYPGDVIVLQPGEYAPCAFTAGVTDTPSEYTIIQSQDFEDPARIRHDGAAEALLDVTGTHLFVFGVAFEGVPQGVAGLRVRDATEIWLRFAELSGVEGAGIRVEGASAGIWVLDDRVEGPGRAVELGCAGCVQEVKVRNSIFAGGTGVWAEPGVTLEVSDVVFEGGAAGVRVGGGAGTTILTANLFFGTEAAIDVAGGPVVVRSNVVHAGSTALRARPDGGAWTGVRVLGNTLSAGAVELVGFDDGSFEVVDNAAMADLGAGNVDCASGGCWVDPSGRDWHPPVGSPLRGAGLGARDDALYEDFCAQVRVEPRTAGALQAFTDEGWGPMPVGVFKEDWPCVLLQPPVDSADTGFHETGGVTERRCGCAGTFGAGWLGVLAAAWVRRRGPARA